MKFFAALLATAALASAASKSLKDYVPECAYKCLDDGRAAATTCKDDTELECFCVLENYRAIYNSAVGCVLLACGNDVSTGEVLPAVIGMCDEVAPTTSWIDDDGSSPPATAPTAGPTDSSATPTASDAPAAATSSPADSGAKGLAVGLALPIALAALAL
ncbi:hypothetical protein QBC38DRAFT_489793 [Podospora fimiseda]|uniref:CFEM domain-containing protein n=1 Tax=Podospora fimiseda TaxID=252190 RepID=A0AAN6YQX6_9PEZI|nr:hypothetical protein QBC38DRAFT_489793 [Podospora fimiseda]